MPATLSPNSGGELAEKKSDARFWIRCGRTRARPALHPTPASLRGGCGASRSTCPRARQPAGVWACGRRSFASRAGWDGIAVARPQPLPGRFLDSTRPAVTHCSLQRRARPRIRSTAIPRGLWRHAAGARTVRSPPIAVGLALPMPPCHALRLGE